MEFRDVCHFLLVFVFMFVVWKFDVLFSSLVQKDIIIIIPATAISFASIVIWRIVPRRQKEKTTVLSVEKKVDP